ncbi:(5-formylfuran-3-yl)methyl phosphate synthase [Hyphomicrobium sp.]|uniref:(5-formylfuran-3-yl)methyl phosphate synthase n=1 Tax=Hyphomicrobium sp. TaxID=82 RepID=UPI002D775AA8|nr:(5-formylfuran-3-yl)methyl phosphate synthase [Hyphomicrobium sp.]HET6387889.1 (5-formylfuran-3-yl)methyl phosphate synthase [Hyphomicrobium sp.]
MIEGLRRGKPAFLASVTNADEAEIALQGGADIIDCKDPASGALGALPLDTVREIVRRVDGRAPVSATVGDLPTEPRVMTVAAVAMAETGVDIVKIGFFGEDDPRAAIATVGAQLPSAKLVAVLMADRAPDFSVLLALAAAGFAGVMLDTAGKESGSLTTVLGPGRLTEFVRTARDNGLFAGLAGSLKEGDIPGLVRLQPDMLGFRGALCSGGRKGAIEAARVSAVRRAIDNAKLANVPPETSVA